MSEAVVTRYPANPVVRGLDIAAKSLLVLMLLISLVNPSLANLEGKAATARAIGYPLLAFTVPLIWHTYWRDRASFPWLADLLITMACFSDLLGNQANLYDSIGWFDDWMHFMNTGVLAAAVVLLTMHRSASVWQVIERCLAIGATGAIAWELAEFFAFIHNSSERQFGYTDTLGDLGLGVLGALIAAVIVHAMWHQGLLRTSAPQLERAHDRGARQLPLFDS